MTERPYLHKDCILTVNGESAEFLVGEIKNLVAKSKNLVALLDEEEKYHGGLVRVETLKAKNELRLELAKWESSK